MDEKKLIGLLGLSVRARQATFGQDGCLKAIRTGKAAVVLVDEDASPATREKYEDACRHNDVPLVMLPEGSIQQASGRPGVAMAIAPGGLAQQICTLSGIDAGKSK
ncbi:MAG: ribosomal L7Ae/L30e/S12e/Gadd45 family protein [Clostridia bacterium]|nr:ribosomal L7Ae/L30e/S12e/Gadd45 family protein [Clostridia bacterium]